MFLEQVLRKTIRPGDIALDIGGHVGAVAACMAGCGASVYSFEPHPEKFAALRVRATPNLHVINCAVSDSEDPVTLHYGVTDESSEASTICPELATAARLGLDRRSIEVPAITLDRFCAARGLRPDVIKIDVEGAESRVLAGASAVLDATPLLIFELSTETELPAHVNDLRRRGYDLYLTEITHFTTRPPTWDHVVTSPMDDCLISFTNAELTTCIPFHANALAAMPGTHDDRIARFHKVPLEAVIPRSTTHRCRS